MQKQTNTAQQISKDLASGITKPFYLVMGEEAFQSEEIHQLLRSHFVGEESNDAFNYESWEGEGVDADKLLSSLETLPGLFDTDDSKRLVVCHRFEKISASALEKLTRYFQNPSDSTVFLVFAAKVDKRKAWFRAIQENGYTVEVREPYEREWPKWQGYFERKIKKKISAEAWAAAVESSGRLLSLLWPEVQKLALFIGDKETITLEDVHQCLAPGQEVDVFAFAESVAKKEKMLSLKQYQGLKHSGENDIKVLSILVRQFRMIDRFQRLIQKGVTDPKQMAGEVGVHPFFLSKIEAQSKFHSTKKVGAILSHLSECDYRLKRGEGELFSLFLVPYFQSL